MTPASLSPGSLTWAQCHGADNGGRRVEGRRSGPHSAPSCLRSRSPAFPPRRPGTYPSFRCSGPASHSAPRECRPRTSPVNLRAGPAHHPAPGLRLGRPRPLRSRLAPLPRWQFQLPPGLAQSSFGVLPLFSPPLMLSSELPDSHDRTTGPAIPLLLLSESRNNIVSSSGRFWRERA